MFLLCCFILPRERCQKLNKEHLALLEKVVEEMILDKQSKNVKLSESQNKSKF